MRQSEIHSVFFFSSRRRHTRSDRDWSSDVCSSDLHEAVEEVLVGLGLDEHFLDRLVNNTDNKGLRLRKLGDTLLERSEKEIRKNPDYVPGKEHVHREDGTCVHGPHDPHVWLGIPQAIAMVNLLRDDLKA